MFGPGPLLGRDPVLSDQEFSRFRRFIYQEAGIDLPPGKLALVQSRLSKRIRQLQLDSFLAYWQLLQGAEGRGEKQRAINLLSTNETYFFREPQHFDWLQQHVRELHGQRRGPIRIWSAACSTGEEPYSIAMTLADSLGLHGNWQVYASDINTQVTAFARRGVYLHERARRTPAAMWRKYLLRGIDEYSGKVRVLPELARKVDFSNVNLLHCEDFRQAQFDVVLLRNVLIYFDGETKQQVLSQLCSKIRPGGYLLIGHSESLRNLDLPLQQEQPSRYRHVPVSHTQR